MERDSVFPISELGHEFEIRWRSDLRDLEIREDPISILLADRSGGMEEEQCQSPAECANNCGFFGNSATLGLCSKCYRDHRLKNEQDATAKIAAEKSLLHLPVSPLRLNRELEVSSSTAPPPPPTTAAAAPPKKPGRCATCSRKIGLTGFNCRCGESFCGSHRLPEQHNCEFDFKSAGREAIARANPVVKTDKLLDKI